MKAWTDTYLDHLEQQHQSQSTLRSKRLWLDSFCQWLADSQHIDDLRAVTFDHIRQYQTHLSQVKRSNGKPTTTAYQHRQIWMLADFFKYLLLREKVLINPCDDLPQLHKPKQLPKGVMTADQVMKLMRQPNLKDPWGFRDRTVMEVLYSSGLRGGEIGRLTIYDVDFQEKVLRVVQGKGRKDRVVPVGQAALKYLDEYMNRVRPVLMQHPQSNRVMHLLFFTRRHHPFTSSQLYNVIKAHRNKAGLPETVTTHSLRHACATEMLKGGASVRHIQELLGHNSIRTTEIYTHVIPHDLQRIHAQTAPSERRKKINVHQSSGL
ncbi:MAG: tyrosine-type recombinase/integrase [Verrucomicrobiota bacterium]